AAGEAEARPGEGRGPAEQGHGRGDQAGAAGAQDRLRRRQQGAEGGGAGGEGAAEPGEEGGQADGKAREAVMPGKWERLPKRDGDGDGLCGEGKKPPGGIFGGPPSYLRGAKKPPAELGSLGRDAVPPKRGNKQSGKARKQPARKVTDRPAKK